ncbi:lanthionine synthetase C family protein [Myceligenerans halotolerans]
MNNATTATMTPAGRQDLSEGPLGIALLHIERGETSAARDHLARATTAGVSAGANASLFHGAPALEFVLSRAGRPGAQVRAAVDQVVDARLESARRRRASGRLPHLAEFDLIRGLTGLAALLLTRDEDSARLRDVLAYLVSLARPVRLDGTELPGWWSAAGPDGREMNGGHSNNGVAHGIAGPLALFALATRRGIQVPGQSEAMDVFATWLDVHGGVYWTTYDQLRAGASPRHRLVRPSWCYGLPGIARAQQLAGIATGNPARQSAAEDALISTLTSSDLLARVTDSTLCHGWAGLLAVVRAVADDSPTPQRFTALTDALGQQLEAHVDLLKKPGLIEGRAGADLARAGTDMTGWTRFLLIT